MNEIDSVLNGMNAPESFLNPEVKNDFLIDEKRKDIWLILLDLLNKFQRVCDKHNLRYFAICGTALGAIRHQGFIPWDDDLDVAMPREDYEKLKSLINEFDNPYSLVWPDVEPENAYSFIKLRNSNTTGMSKAFSNLNINHGLFLDIFPLDEVLNLEAYESEQSRIKELIIENSNRMKMMNGMDANDRKNLSKEILSTFHSIETFASKDNGKNGKYLALRTISFYPASKMIWNKDVFKESNEVPFEFMKIKVPVGWIELLETNYGDWKRFPPVDQRGFWHSGSIFDPILPYVAYKDSIDITSTP